MNLSRKIGEIPKGNSIDNDFDNTTNFATNISSCIIQKAPMLYTHGSYVLAYIVWGKYQSRMCANLRTDKEN